jgi:IS5 family transposase
MNPKASAHANPQRDLFHIELQHLVDCRHPLVQLADQIQWPEFEVAFTPLFCADNGRAACPVRLMVGLHYLKHTFDLSDEDTVAQWVENPYWQYFCGGKFFEHRLPIDPSSMSRWRGRLKEAGVETMLAELIATGLRSGAIRPTMLERINVDTTVQEKFIRFPTDARLYDRMRERLVRAAQRRGIGLRQSYTRVGRWTLTSQQRYASAQQFRRARRMTKRLRTLLGRVVRDIERQTPQRDESLAELLSRARRLLAQQRTDHEKLYSVHAPEVECLAKGKVQKRYEFGCKVSVASTSRGNWIVGARALHGNPYDGHTLGEALQQVARLSGQKPQTVFVDLGYRGHGAEDDAVQIQVVPRKRRHLAKSLRGWMNRRAAIEPVIGHLKTDHRMQRNRLKGRVGDQLNAVLSACGFNLRKLLRAFFCLDGLKSWLAALRYLLQPQSAHRLACNHFFSIDYLVDPEEPQQSLISCEKSWLLDAD